jgi:hypothetical protein
MTNPVEQLINMPMLEILTAIIRNIYPVANNQTVVRSNEMDKADGCCWLALPLGFGGAWSRLL